MSYEIKHGNALDVLKTMPDGSVQTVVTSPPYYGLRDYGVDGQIGLEETPEAYISKLVAVFAETRRVLKDDGVLWVNIGDSYAGSGGAGGDYAEGGLKDGQPRYEGTGKQMRRSFRRDKAAVTPAQPSGPGLKAKDLIGIPWMLAFALRADGWYLRQDIIWHKPNPMPESVTDRCTKSHEYIFLLSKSARYFYDNEAIAEPSNYGGYKDARAFSGKNAEEVQDPKWENRGRENRNRRSVWTVSTKPYKEAHFATYPEDLIEPCIRAGSKPGDTVLDPFNGSGTTGAVCVRLGREYVGIELNPKYIELAHKRIKNVNPPLMPEAL